MKKKIVFVALFLGLVLVFGCPQQNGPPSNGGQPTLPESTDGNLTVKVLKLEDEFWVLDGTVTVRGPVTETKAIDAGFAEFEILEGLYSVTVDAPGFVSETEAAEVIAGIHRQINFYLERAEDKRNWGTKE